MVPVFIFRLLLFLALFMFFRAVRLRAVLSLSLHVLSSTLIRLPKRRVNIGGLRSGR